MPTESASTSRERSARSPSSAGWAIPTASYTSQSPTNGLLLPTTTYGTPTSVDRLSRRGRSGRPDPSQEHQQAQCQRGQRLRADGRRTRASCQLLEQGYPTYVSSTGDALTNAVVTTSGSIGQTNINGTSLNTEIKTGFDLTSYLAGLEGTRSASQIEALKVRRAT